MFDIAAGAADERTITAVEAELAAMSAHEVKDSAECLALRAAQTTAKLLQKQRRTLGRTQHQHGVDGRDVDAFVEEVDREDNSDLAGGQSLQRSLTFSKRAVTPYRDGWNVVLIEVIRHELGVFDADAEPEGSHSARLLRQSLHLLDHGAGPGVGARVQVA